MHNFLRSTTFVLVASPSKMLTIKHMDSFGINSTESYGVHLDIQMISNKKNMNYKVVDLVKYYNFDIDFSIIE
jgi:hypothetical protein